MRRIICVFLVLTFVLCGCTQKPKDPVFDVTPFEDDETVTVRGESFNLYELDGVKYVKAWDLENILGVSVDVYQGVLEHSARIKLGGKYYLLTTMSEISDLEISDIVGKQDEERLMQINSTDFEGIYKDCIFDGNCWFLKQEYVMPCFEGLHKFEDTEKRNTYFTEYPLASEVPEGKKLPVPMYHAVSDDLWSPLTSLFVSPENMEKQLKYITENGYTTVTFEDMANIDKIEKPVMLTFDDGYDDNYTELFPLLKKYNAKVTIFLITDLLDTEHYLTCEQVTEMNESGLVSFQSHTVTHPFLGDCDEAKLEYEMKQSKLEIARLTGKEPFVLCYPTGDYSELSLVYTEKHYQFGLLMSGSTYKTGRNPLKITRDYISRKTSLDSFISMID